MFRLRKAVTLTAALAAAVCGLAACGGSGNAASSGKVLKAWWYESPGSAYYTAWSQAIKIFKKAHTGVRVEFSDKSFN